MHGTAEQKVDEKQMLWSQVGVVQDEHSVVQFYQKKKSKKKKKLIFKTPLPWLLFLGGRGSLHWS